MYWQKRFDKENPDQRIEEKYLRFVKNIKITDIVEFLESFAIRSSTYYLKARITGNIIRMR